jgi:hypothetical protein
MDDDGYANLGTRNLQKKKFVRELLGRDARGRHLRVGNLLELFIGSTVGTYTC